jgi:predicted transposase/invertase (TIGR01784 family)
MEQITKPHDRFFKETLSQVETARDFVRHYLPDEMTALMNLDTLDVTKDSFVDQELKERFSDLVYRVDLKEEGQVFVYLLFEHKSYPESDVALHLLSYMVRLWLQHLKQGKALPLPAVIPMVIYHGETKWGIPLGFRSLVKAPGVMMPLTPDFQYLLWDLSDYTDEEIKGGVFLRVAFLLMKHIFSKDMGEKLPGILKLLCGVQHARSGLHYLESALRYVASGSSHVKKEDILRAVKEALDDKGGDIMATLAEQWIEEGVQKGIEKGMIQNAREMVLEAILSRFEKVPEDIIREVSALDNRAVLKRLHREAIICPDLTGFRKALDNLS